MFRLYQHHDASTLAALLAALREQQRPASPLAADTLIVPNRGTARWLQAELAASEGAVANLDLPLMAEFVWSALRATLPDVPANSNYTRERLTWHLHALLPTIERQEVAYYLSATPASRQRFQLAERLADVFDQYLIHRRDVLVQWEAGHEAMEPPACWQAPVWRALVERLGPRHRARLLGEFLDRARTGALDGTALPPRIFAFALVDLPLDYLRLLRALGQVIDVHFLLPNPSATWWGEARRGPVAPAELAQAEFAQAELALADPDPGKPASSENSDADSDHPLLASFGRAGRDFLQHLYGAEDADAGFADVSEPELGPAFEPAPPTGDTLLARIQADLVAGSVSAPTTDLPTADDSVQIHACPGPLREVQVLHDHLLDLLSRHPDLEPREILVMLPDVARYAPAIRSVFEAARGSRHIPFRIADRPRLDSHPVARTFAALIDLPLARWTASEILGLAEVPAVMRRFGLDDSDLDPLRTWTQAAGVRWGLDAESRAAAGAASWEQNTWRFGLDRLLLGLAQSNDLQLVDNVAPWSDLEGGQATAVGRLWLLLDQLRTWRDRLREPATATVWQERFNAMIHDLFAPDPEDGAEAAALEILVEAVATLETASECLDDEVLDHEAVREALFGALAAGGQRQPLVSGAVTFCGTEPLRGVPFRVIALLGVDDGVFPRQDGDRAFNLIRRHPRLGDPSARDSDRMMFLQALAAARDCLYISYTGRDLADGAELQPSPIVGELLDFIHGHYLPASNEASRTPLVREQPLHPFSPSYFRGDDAHLFTFVADWEATAQALAGPRTAPEGFVDDSELEDLAADSDVGADSDVQTPIALAELQAFYRHPPRWFFQRRMRLQLDPTTARPADDEPVALDRLALHTLRSRLLERAIREGHTCIAFEPDAFERALGELPAPPLGADDFAAAAADVNAVLPVHQELQRLPLTTITIDLKLEDGSHLTGRLDRVGEDEWIVVRAGGLRLANQLSPWLAWLALVASGHEQRLRLVGARDGERETRVASLSHEQARKYLHEAIAWYRTGARRPVLFEPWLAEHYLKELGLMGGKANDPAKALKSTNGWLSKEFQAPHAASDPDLLPLFAPSPHPLGDDVETAEFVQVCDAVARPAVESLRDEEAEP